MKRTISLILALILVAALIAGCSKQDAGQKTAQTPTAANSAKSRATEPLTGDVQTIEEADDDGDTPEDEPPQEQEEKVIDNSAYTAVDLAKMPLSEIIELMGGGFMIEYEGSHLIHYTSGGLCIYNDKTLPGFAFFVKPAEGYSYDDLPDPSNLIDSKNAILQGEYQLDFLSAYGSARFDNVYSADMTYNEVVATRGSNEILPMAGAEEVRMAIESADGTAGTIHYDYAGAANELVMESQNPGIRGIVVFPPK